MLTYDRASWKMAKNHQRTCIHTKSLRRQIPVNLSNSSLFSGLCSALLFAFSLNFYINYDSLRIFFSGFIFFHRNISHTSALSSFRPSARKMSYQWSKNGSIAWTRIRFHENPNEDRPTSSHVDSNHHLIIAFKFSVVFQIRWRWLERARKYRTDRASEYSKSWTEFQGDWGKLEKLFNLNIYFWTILQASYPPKYLYIISEVLLEIVFTKSAYSQRIAWAVQRGCIDEEFF